MLHEWWRRMKSGKSELAPPAILFGIPVARETEAELLDQVVLLARQPREGRCRVVVTLNVDFVVNAVSCWFHRARPGLLPVLQQADLVTADGMPVVLLSRLSGASIAERVTGADMVPALAERAAREHLTLYFLGGTPENTGAARDLLCRKYPELQIVGVDTPFVSAEDTPESRADDAAICARISAAKPDLLLVAFGNPKQELWIGRNAGQLDAGAAIGIGGSFNFLIGSVKRAPRWMQRCGVEWVYRVIQEPKRLWKRYGLGLLKFNWLVGLNLCARIMGWCAGNRQLPQVTDAAEVTIDFQGVNRLNQPVLRELCRARKLAARRGAGLEIRHLSKWARIQLRLLE